MGDNFFYAEEGCRHIICVWGPQPLNSPRFVDLLCPLRNYGGITSEWSPLGPRAHIES